jgi:Zn-dependent protease
VAQERGFRIGSFAGAAVIIEPAFLLLALYIVGSAALSGGMAAVPQALVFVAIVFAAILIHELGHAAMAASLNIPSKRIVLTFFGGYVQFAREPKLGWHEIAVSAAGPGANLASYALVASALPLLAPTVDNIDFLSALQTFGFVSLLLGLFNLLPGFPLDGGHILRAALTYVMQRNMARIVTAVVGMLVAGALLLFALSQGFIWSVFIAGLLGLAAWAELRAARAERQRGGPSDTMSNT